MARGDRVADGERVVRYVRPGWFEGETVFSSAFELRKGEEGLSVNRLSFFDAEAGRDLAIIRTTLTARKLVLKATGGLAEIGVADVNEVAGALNLDLAVLECPLDADTDGPANMGHAEIDGLPPPGTDDSDIRAQRAKHDLARKCKPIHPTR